MDRGRDPGDDSPALLPSRTSKLGLSPRREQSAAQHALPELEERLQLDVVGVEELLHGEAVGHGDHERGEGAQARLLDGGRVAEALHVQVAVPVVQRRDPRPQLVVEHHVRQDREEVAEGGAVVDQAAVAGDEAVHALVAARQLSRLATAPRLWSWASESTTAAMNAALLPK